MMWWLGGFPFAVWAQYGWATPFVTAIVTFLLMATENIGIQIEEPFKVLPMASIADSCVQGVYEILAHHSGIHLGSRCSLHAVDQIAHHLISRMYIGAQQEFGQHGDMQLQSA